MSDKILVTCDCTCANTCPQGRIGSRAKCRILRDPQIEATIERPTASPSDIELVTIGTLRRDVADLRSRINAVSSALQGTDHEGENVKRRLNDISKQLVANEDAMKTQDRAIGILGETTDNLEKHCEALETSRSILHQEQFAACKRIGKLEEVVQPKTASVSYEGVTVAGKRVFKGGWVNIYLHAAGPYWMRPCCSRADADTNAAESAERRIACIQIPDITEGEGL